MSDDPTSQWRGLGALVDSGQLYLERGAAERCAKRCAEFVAELVTIKEGAKRLATMDGFGDHLQSGIALATKFERKASGGDYSMDQAIDDHIAVVLQMQQTFEKIEAAYDAADQAGAQGISGAGTGL